MCVYAYICECICASICAHTYYICIRASTYAPPNFQRPLLRGGRPPRSHRRLRPGGGGGIVPPRCARCDRGTVATPHERPPREAGGRCPSAAEGMAGTGSRGRSRTCYRGRGPSSTAARQPRRGHRAAILGGGEGPGEARRERLSSVGRGTRCPAPVGAVREPRARRRRGGAAESGGDRSHGRPSVPVGVLCVCVCLRLSPSPIRQMRFLFVCLFFSKTAWSARAVPLGLPPAHVICLYSPLISASYITAFEHMST